MAECSTERVKFEREQGGAKDGEKGGVEQAGTRAGRRAEPMVRERAQKSRAKLARNERSQRGERGAEQRLHKQKEWAAKRIAEKSGAKERGAKRMVGRRANRKTG